MGYQEQQKAFYRRDCECRAYLAANPTLSDASARWVRYEDMILAKYGGADLNEAWLRRGKPMSEADIVSPP
jgi:hypothetical protein